MRPPKIRRRQQWLHRPSSRHRCSVKHQDQTLRNRSAKD